MSPGRFGLEYVSEINIQYEIRCAKQNLHLII